MKDLLVYVADADALAFMRSTLNKHQALGIRAISFDIERHPQRDAGMVQSGAELARMKKGRYGKALLMWDHHGSGRDHKQEPIRAAGDIQGKLDAYTWSGNSAVVVLVPELEQWLWHCENAVAAHCGVTTAQLGEWVAERAQKLNISAETLKQEQPKELFEYVMREKLKRTVSPRDFEEIGKRAGITGLLACDSFRSIVDALRLWFPPDMAALDE
ncbi:methylation-associated defense system protein MAD4 [Methyloversatilis thermotolerans]|uniref:methylation-associated defense system protein MAD4 n=1 Tax=Methyloversatilis thermotolerans TaxID=1346290 RepID=UPI000380D22C|nr:hypothetical protein [Methyloversatilis thermotolerans]